MITRLYFLGVATAILLGIAAVGFKYRDKVKEQELTLEVQTIETQEYRDVRKKIDQATSVSRTADDARQRLLDRQKARTDNN